MDKLFESEESTTEDLDFEAILGPTKDGEWQEQDQEVLKETQVFKCV